MGTRIYDEMMAYYDEHLDEESKALQHKVWDPTPWVVNVNTGSLSEDRSFEMMDWCRNNLGDESWPIHGRPGVWRRGGATIHGWTYFGFVSEKSMSEFMFEFPDHCTLSAPTQQDQPE